MSNATGQAEELIDRLRRDRNRRWAVAWASVLAMRFRGVDPDRFLGAVHDGCRWLFSRLALVAYVAVLVIAAQLLIVHFGEFKERLPAVSALFDWRNLPWLLLAIGTVKVIHELGHGLACKHFGGEVRELGFMLLVFAPCLYCDVSDTWRFPNKWHRIAVSAAGMIVELFLAALATIVWWYAQPGVVQLVALNVMIVCSVNTLLVNGNPLLRYDGYYVLSDVVGTPNLWQRSRDVLRRITSRSFFTNRVLSGDDPLVPAGQRPWLALYAAASKVYLTVVFVAIVWGMVKFLHPYHLENLAYILGFTVVGSALVQPISSGVRLARNPIRRAELRKGRAALIMTLVAATVVGVLAIPVNYNVTAPVVLMPEDAARIYANTDGTLADILPAGTTVKRGDVIGKLTNTYTQLELAKLEGEQRLRQLRVDHLERLRGIDREANDELPTARSALADTTRRLEEIRREAQRLTLVAPTDGIIIAAPRHKSAEGAGPTLRLAKWSGSLLDKSNGGAYVEPGTLVCLVGNPHRLTAVVLVDDTDVKRLKAGQKARLRLEQLPGQVIEGEVVEVARHQVRNPGTSGPTDLDALYAGVMPPDHTSPLYQAHVRLGQGSGDEGQGPAGGVVPLALDSRPWTLDRLVIGGRGEAKVAAECITFGRLIWRYFAQTFRLPM